MKITLKDIAEDTGLSISTVSRALARKGKISQISVRKVYESARKLNYPVYLSSTPLELRKTIYVALVTTFHPGEFYASFFNGFTQAAEGTNIHFGLFNVCGSQGGSMDFLESVKKDHFDAAVLFLPGLMKEDYEELISRTKGFPTVSVAPIATPVMDTIVFDNYSGGHLAGKHFHQKGYKKIGIIQGPSTELESHLRKNGLIDYCDQSGLEIVYKFRCDYDISSGKRAYEYYKSQDVKPEAIFACNDALAIGFMHSALRDGLKIPGDVAIAGYDDIPICEYQHPRLTSVRTPFRELGKTVIELLTRQLGEDREAISHSGTTQLVPVSLIERESA